MKIGFLIYFVNTRKAKNSIKHQSDLAVNNNKVSTKVSTNQKHEKIKVLDIFFAVDRSNQIGYF